LQHQHFLDLTKYTPVSLSGYNPMSRLVYFVQDTTLSIIQPYLGTLETVELAIRPNRILHHNQLTCLAGPNGAVVLDGDQIIESRLEPEPHRFVTGKLLESDATKPVDLSDVGGCETLALNETQVRVLGLTASSYIDFNPELTGYPVTGALLGHHPIVFWDSSKHFSKHLGITGTRTEEQGRYLSQVYVHGDFLGVGTELGFYVSRDRARSWHLRRSDLEWPVPLGGAVLGVKTGRVYFEAQT
jgi:hypothetical protein